MKAAVVWATRVVSALVLALGCSRGNLGYQQGCVPGSSECVGERLLRICPEDGAGYLALSCGEGEKCEAGACVGPCANGVSTCLSKELLRVCSAAGDTIGTVACPLGSECTKGVCSAIDPKPLCNAGELRCATRTVAEECDSQGTAWVMTACALGERCAADSSPLRCIPDASASACQPNTSVCLDQETALHCAKDGSGYGVQHCPASAPCVNGQCRGELCVVGESRCEAPPSSPTPRDAVLTCVDGASFSATYCAPGESCVFDGVLPSDAPKLLSWWNAGQVGEPPVPLPTPRSASCQPAACSPGFNSPYLSVQCGDPSQPSASDTDTYSSCEGYPPFSSYQWVSYRCPEHSHCDPARVRLSAEVCTLEGCFSNDVRCTSDRLGLETCDDSGSFQPLASCGAGRVCETNDFGLAVCVDAECAYFINLHRAERGGRCESATRFRPCGPDGRLGAVDASCGDCELEPAVSSPGIPMPFQPGVCVGPRGNELCTKGETSCTSADQYWECTGSTWQGAKLHRCPTGTNCFVKPDPQPGQQEAVCAECSPGNARCTNDFTVQFCDASGRWLTPTQCDGFCRWGERVTGESGYGCQPECLPDSAVCVGSNSYQKCGPDARLDDAITSCPAGTSCRTSQRGTSLGCVECMGPSHAAATDSFDLPDSRCQGNSLIECQDDDTWGPARDCGSKARCVQTTSVGSPAVWATCTLL